MGSAILPEYKTLQRQVYYPQEHKNKFKSSNLSIIKQPKSRSTSDNSKQRSKVKNHTVKNPLLGHDKRSISHAMEEGEWLYNLDQLSKEHARRTQSK